MTRLEVLDETVHAGLGLLPPGAGDAAPGRFIPVVVTELRELAVEFPVVLIKNPETGQFGLFALCGFADGENLGASPGGEWTCHYRPLDLRRGPFALAPAGQGQKGAIAIERDHPRLSPEGGDPLFEDGRHGPAVERHKPVLQAILEGLAPTQALIAALTEHDLIAPARIPVNDPSGDFTVEGFYTVDTQAASRLSADVLHRLNRTGLLFAVHLLMASMANVAKLLARRVGAD